MHKLNEKKPTESPFFNLLADADEVQIREIPSNSRSLRTFFVHIKTPPADQKPKEPEDKRTYDNRQLHLSATLLLENKDFLLARNIYSYLLQQNLRDPDALRGLGICLFKLGEVTSSRKCFLALTELYHSEDALYWLGLGYQSQNQDAAAVTHFEKVTKPNTFHLDQRFDFHKNYGNCLTRLGQLDQAESQYLKAMELCPCSDTIHVNLGTLLIQRSDWAGALKRFIRGAELNPGNSRAYCGMGLTELASGNEAKAKARFHQALDLDPQNLVALHQLLDLSNLPEEYRILKTRLRTFLEKEPTHADSHHALAVLLFKEGGWKECEIHVNRALECSPEHAGAVRLREDLNSLVRNQAMNPNKGGEHDAHID